MLEKVYSYYTQYYQPAAGTTRPAQKDPDLVDVHLGLVIMYPKGVDQYTFYISEAPFRFKTDILNWWGTAGPEDLRQMAFDLLSIPAMSAEVERIFSSAKRLLTPERNALTADNLEIYEVLRNWWLHDIVLQQDDTESGKAIF